MGAYGWALLWQESECKEPQNKLWSQLESIVTKDIQWLVISKCLVLLKNLERFPGGVGDHVHRQQRQQHPKKGRGFLGRRTEVQYPLRGIFFFGLIVLPYDCCVPCLLDKTTACSKLDSCSQCPVQTEVTHRAASCC